MSDNIFFIVGTGRNGSKMLRKMLSKHRRLGIMVESHFLPTLLERYGNEPITPKQFYNLALAHFGSQKQRWLYDIARFEGCSIRRLNRYITSEVVAGTKRTVAGHYTKLGNFLYGPDIAFIGDKTPSYGQYADMLHTAFGNAKFIHLQRDGVFAARSMINHQGFVKVANGLDDYDRIAQSHFNGAVAEFPNHPINLERATELFNALQSRTIAALSRVPQENVLTVQYEELLRNPEEQLCRISDFLGIPFTKHFKRQAGASVRTNALSDMARSFTREEYLAAYANVAEINQNQGYSLDRFDWYNEVKSYQRSWAYAALNGIKTNMLSKFFEKFRRRIKNSFDVG